MITFPLGLPGFEQCRKFVVLDSEEWAPLRHLHAIEAPVSFLVVDPRVVLPGYRCVLSQTDLVRLGATESDVLLWLAIVTVGRVRRTRAPTCGRPSSSTPGGCSATR